MFPEMPPMPPNLDTIEACLDYGKQCEKEIGLTRNEIDELRDARERLRGCEYNMPTGDIDRMLLKDIELHKRWIKRLGTVLDLIKQLSNSVVE